MLVELKEEAVVDTFRLKQQLHISLENELGEQKIDIVIDDGQTDKPFLAVIRQQGVELWTND